ncbi:MAG: ABC transporter permease [Ferruginibacter sp.]
MKSFIYSFESEWLKKKRSLGSWLVIVGAFFTPVIIIIARLIRHTTLEGIYEKDNFWRSLWHSSWESMAIFLLPMGVIMATSLITQLEYKNNTWKQLHTLPLSYTTIFFSKLLVIVVMVLQFFILFNIGIYLSAVIPYMLVSGVHYPAANIPFAEILKEDLLFFIDCLPIIALQYLISLQFKNFLLPIGIGFGLWMGSISALSWKFGYLIPYTYSMLNFLKDGNKAATPGINIHYLAIGYFIIFTIVSYWLYVRKNEKG